jgi:hypothetical protein
MWAGQTTSDASGNFSCDISSASFSTVLAAVATAINNTSNAIQGDLAWIRAISTTAITGTIVHGVTAVIASNTLAVETATRTINVIVIGT